MTAIPNIYSRAASGHLRQSGG